MSTKDDEDNAETRHSGSNTPDVTLAFVDWLQKARHGSWLHLIYNVGALQNIRLWDFGEDGGFYHWYRTQHESFGHKEHEYPASKDNSTTYYDENDLPLHRPTRPHFTKDKRSYPLRHTRHIFDCPNCSGSGEIECTNCNGKQRCPSCKGNRYTGSGKDTKPCSSCKGSGKCSKCNGSGKIRCEKCKGEGQLLRYTSKDYKWWEKVDEKQTLSPAVDRSPVRGLIKKARQDRGSIKVSEFSEDEVMRATGIINARIRELIQLANAERQALERSIESQSSLVVFQNNRREYIPLSYINMFADNKYGQFFAAGTKQPYKVHHPPMPLSAWKITGWLSLISVIALLVSVPVNVWPLMALLGLLGGAIGVNSWKAFQELKQPIPKQWFIFDDNQHGAWQFAHVLAQAISRAHVAYVADPWFTALLEPPKPDSAKSRHSFMYTVRHHHQSNSLQQIEIIVVGNRAQKQYFHDVKHLMQSATRLTWIAGGRTTEELDRIIEETIDCLSEERRKAVEISVICDERTALIAPEQFSRVQDKVDQAKFSVLVIPMQQMCDEALSGFVSEKADQNFQHLIEHSGLRLVTLDSGDIREQISLELPPDDVSSRDAEIEDKPQPDVNLEHPPKA
jgi:xanthosine utilization system XapX-like protein